MKRIVSFLLVLAIVFSLMAGMEINSGAAVVTEKESNNIFESANKLTLGNELCGKIDSGSDVDYYKIVPNSNGKINLVFNHEYTEEHQNYLFWDIIVYRFIDNKYKELGSYRVFGNSNIKESLQSIAKDKGEYYIKVSCDWNGYSVGIEYSIATSKIIPAPFALRCIARSINAQKVTWNKVAGVTGYQVQCSDGGSKWAQTKTGTGNCATFKGLTAGGKYKFRVRTYKDIDGTRYYSGWSSTLCSCAKPATVTLKSVSSPKKKQVKTTWAKAGGVVSGYQIYYGKNASFTSLAAKKIVSGKSTTSYTGKNFTKGRTYYVKVRTYTVFNGVTYYGDWSATKKVKSK